MKHASHMKAIEAIGAFSMLALSSGTFAQMMGNPAGLAPDTPGVDAGSPRADYSNTQDKLFVREAALGGAAEVQAGKLAQSRASDKAVKDFAKRMVTEHSAANDRLRSLGGKINPDQKLASERDAKTLDPEHQRMQQELQQTKNFDADYLTSQIADHQRTANLLLWELSYGQNAALTKYAADNLPVVLEHLDIAKREYARLRQP